jgi:RNA polymerase sigma-70 factor (ECF subfamily)
MSKFRALDQSEQDILTKTLVDYNFETIDFEFLFEKINAAIKNLPEQCRIVFEQSRFKRKTYGEIATGLNISTKTVEAHISLALKKLREEIKEFL